MKSLNALILAATFTALLAPVAHADTFLQYSTTSSTDTITFDGTTLTGTAIPVNLSYLDPVTGELATGTLNFSATVDGPAGYYGSPFFLYDVPVDDISFSITNGATNILSGTATSGDLEGPEAGLMLSPDSGVSFTSALYGLITDPGFQIGIGYPSVDLSISSGTLSSFDASAGTGSFTGTASVTPEPSSLALLGTGLLAMVGIARRKLAA